MTKHISMDEIRKLSKRSHNTLYGPDIVDTNQDTCLVEGVASDENHSSMVDNSESSLHSIPNKHLENALKLMRSHIDSKHIFLFRQEASTIAQIKGGATLKNAETEALDNNLIKKHAISKAKTEICLWEITDAGYIQLGISPKKWQSKGGYRHKFCTYRIADQYRELGYNVTIEYQHTNGKLIDLCCQKSDEMIFIEVCASNPLSKEISNLEKDISSDSLPDKLIFAVTQRKMKKELQTLISTEGQLPCPVEIVIAGDLIEIRNKS